MIPDIYPAQAGRTLWFGSAVSWSAMQDNVTLTADDEGKNVINASGDQVGRVIEVEHGNAYVDPDPGLTDTIRSKLGWGEGDEESYQLDTSSIESVSDNEIHLRR
jgi:hypothetical protein